MNTSDAGQLLARILVFGEKIPEAELIKAGADWLLLEALWDRIKPTLGRMQREARPLVNWLGGGDIEYSGEYFEPEVYLMLVSWANDHYGNSLMFICQDGGFVFASRLSSDSWNIVVIRDIKQASEYAILEDYFHLHTVSEESSPYLYMSSRLANFWEKSMSRERAKLTEEEEIMRIAISPLRRVGWTFTNH